jgi:multidrug efflux system membrane fusion protein
MDAKMLIAAGLCVAVGAYMVTGDFVVSGTAQTATVPPPAQRSEESDALFRVRVRTLEAIERPQYIAVRGRTRADALVAVAAETTGRVEERLVERGAAVKRGDILCRLDEGVRAAELAQAKAEMAKAELEFRAATQLQGRGFESETRVATTRAALDAASAGVAAAEQELDRTIVRAPIDGLVQEPLAETGAMLAMGEVCATIVDADPMYVTGQVAEREVGGVAVGETASVRLITGDTAEGVVTYVANTADPQTRTFTVEVRVDNADGRLRDGVTATADIPVASVRAHRLSPGILTLNEEGAVGVRTVDDEGRVAFAPVSIVRQDTEGFWVTGLPETVTVIVVGQEYVVDGQVVEPVAEGA